jgi:hypothetical protein
MGFIISYITESPGLYFNWSNQRIALTTTAATIRFSLMIRAVKLRHYADLLKQYYE